MSLGQSILTALFVMSVVFVVLIILWGIIRVFSVIVKIIERKTRGNDSAKGRG